MRQDIEKDSALSPAKASEAREILALYRAAAAAGQARANSDWNEEYPAMTEVQADLESGALLTLRADGGLAAAVSVLADDDLNHEPLPWTPAHACVLSRLCVAPALQGRGVGARVLRLAERHAKGAGYQAARLLASAGNPAALRLYRAAGYRRVGEAHLYGMDFIALEKLLD